jgi:hypothetical protein
MISTCNYRLHRRAGWFAVTNSHVKFHQPGSSSLSILDLNANVNIGCRSRTGDDISSLPVLCTGELKMYLFSSASCLLYSKVFTWNRLFIWRYPLYENCYPLLYDIQFPWMWLSPTLYCFWIIKCIHKNKEIFSFSYILFFSPYFKRRSTQASQWQAMCRFNMFKWYITCFWWRDEKARSKQTDYDGHQGMGKKRIHERRQDEQKISLFLWIHLMIQKQYSVGLNHIQGNCMS